MCAVMRSSFLHVLFDIRIIEWMNYEKYIVQILIYAQKRMILNSSCVPIESTVIILF